jgi:hypothetical protein
LLRSTHERSSAACAEVKAQAVASRRIRCRVFKVVYPASVAERRESYIGTARLARAAVQHVLAPVDAGWIAQ